MQRGLGIDRFGFAPRKMERAIIYIGGSYPQISNIVALRSAGLAVVLVDQNQNCPGSNYATETHGLSALNVEGLVTLTLELKKRYQILFAYGVADFCYYAIEQIHRTLGYPYLYVNYDNFTQKSETKKIFRKANIPHPRQIASANSLKKLLAEVENNQYSGSSVLKIDGLNNSAGVFYLRETTKTAVKHQLENSGYENGPAFIEEHVQDYDRLVNIDGFLVDGIYVPVTTTSRILAEDDKRRNLVMIQPALNLTESQIETLVKYSVNFSAAASYYWGPISIDFLHKSDGSFCAIEASPHFHAISSTIKLIGLSPLEYLARELLSRDTVETKRIRATTCFHPRRPGHIACHQLFHDGESPIDINDLLKKWLVQEYIFDGCSLDRPDSTGGWFVGLAWQHINGVTDAQHLQKMFNREIAKRRSKI